MMIAATPATSGVKLEVPSEILYLIP